MAKRQQLGAYAESMAARYFSVRHGTWLHPDRHGGDITIRTIDGELLRVEVKAASMGKDGKWRFRTRCKGHCDHNKSDLLLLMAKTGGFFTAFLMPVWVVKNVNCVSIGSHPKTYAGKYAKFRQDLDKLSLALMPVSLVQGDEK